MRSIWALTLFAFSAGCHSSSSGNAGAELATRSAQTVHLFPTATEVRLFVDTGRTDSKHHSILSPETGIPLTKSQRDELEKSLVWNQNFGKDDVAACFLPHHFFGYFDKNHRRLGTVSVCFCCGGVEVIRGDGKLIYDEDRLSINLSQVKALVSSMHEPTDIACDPQGG
jgi:hypothetical protein